MESAEAVLLKRVRAHALFLAGYPPMADTRERNIATLHLRFTYSGQFPSLSHVPHEEIADLRFVSARLEEWLEAK